MSLTLKGMACKGECKWNLNHAAFLKMGERKKHLLKVVHTSLLQGNLYTYYVGLPPPCLGN